MELLASGRMAEVFAWDDGRVLKLDRPEWNGCAALEQAVLERVMAAGIAAPRPHETVTVDGRLGVVLDRIDGPLLGAVIAAPGADLDALAGRWTTLHTELNGRTMDGLVDLVSSLRSGIQSGPFEPALTGELLALLERLDDGGRTLCHFDLHPDNVIVGADGWVVIDWLSASAGPPAADFARTLVLDPPGDRNNRARFSARVMRLGLQERGFAREELDAWVRVVAGARISEGFTGEYAEFLATVASGSRRIDG